MKKTAKPKAKPKVAKLEKSGKVERRRYDSQVRQQQTADTRDRIIAAGAEIAHRLSAWDWSEMTFKAVGNGAGVSERTVHRYFSSERLLRDAVLQRLVQASGVSLQGLELGDFAGVATGVYKYLSSFAAHTTNTNEPSFAALDQLRREVLLGAVSRATKEWPLGDQEIAAAMLDMLWNPSAYERLSTAWHLDTPRATSAITWVVGLVEDAIRQGRRPSSKK